MTTTNKLNEAACLISIVTLGNFPSNDLSLTIRLTLERVNSISLEWIFVLYDNAQCQAFLKSDEVRLLLSKSIVPKAIWCDSGISNSMNLGIGISKADWLLVLHAGDYLIISDQDKESLRHNLLCEESMIQIYGTFYRNYRGDLIPTRHYEDNKCRSFLYPWVPHQSTFVKREVYQEVSYDAFFKSAMDYDFFLKCSKLGIKATVFPEFISVFQLGGTSSNIVKSLKEVYFSLLKNNSSNFFSWLSVNFIFFHIVFLKISFLLKEKMVLAINTVTD